MYRYFLYSLFAVALVLAQVQFNIAEDIAHYSQEAFYAVIGAPRVLTENIQFRGGVTEVRNATINTIEKVFVPKEPLFVSGGGDISETNLTVAGIVVESNIERALNAQASLQLNPVLSEAAYNKAKDMLDNQYFAHVSPDGEGPSDVVDAVGYDYILVGENLAMGVFKDDGDLVEAWMNSPGHRANILHERFTEIGVGIVQGEYDGNRVWIAVQEFGLPRSACPAINTVLSNEIEKNQNQLEAWESELRVLKERIEEDRRKSDVDAYNSLVEKFNSLVEKTKRDVGIYNESVRAYNSCISG